MSLAGADHDVQMEGAGFGVSTSLNEWKQSDKEYDKTPRVSSPHFIAS